MKMLKCNWRVKKTTDKRLLTYYNENAFIKSQDIAKLKDTRKIILQQNRFNFLSDKELRETAE